MGRIKIAALREALRPVAPWSVACEVFLVTKRLAGKDWLHFPDFCYHGESCQPFGWFFFWSIGNRDGKASFGA